MYTDLIFVDPTLSKYGRNIGQMVICDWIRGVDRFEGHQLLQHWQREGQNNDEQRDQNIKTWKKERWVFQEKVSRS